MSNEVKKSIVPVACLAKTSKDQKELWIVARNNGTMTQSEEEVTKLLTYEFLAGLGETATGVEISNILHNAFTQVAGIVEQRFKVESRKATYLEAISILDAMVTDAKGGASSIFGKGILAQATRNLSGLKFDKPVKAVASSEDDGDTVEAETL